jgi:hypothetical protein
MSEIKLTVKEWAEKYRLEGISFFPDENEARQFMRMHMNIGNFARVMYCKLCGATYNDLVFQHQFNSVGFPLTLLGFPIKIDESIPVGMVRIVCHPLTPNRVPFVGERLSL